jgi:hypothetical protein
MRRFNFNMWRHSYALPLHSSAFLFSQAKAYNNYVYMQFNLQPMYASLLPFETIKMQLLKNPENASGNKDKFQANMRFFSSQTDSRVWDLVESY